MSQQKYVCLLRGINVSGKNIIKMAELRKQLEALNLEEVETYIQSGNILFRAAMDRASTLAEEIKAMIREVFGHDITVMCITKEDFQRKFQLSPYMPEKEEEITKLLFTLLSDTPDPELIPLLEAKCTNGEEYIIIENGIYGYYPNGFGRSKLTNNVIERILKTGATGRNWKTMRKLNAMLGE